MPVILKCGKPVARSIKSKRHVIIGGEDSVSYTHNFMDHLFELGYLTVRLTPFFVTPFFCLRHADQSLRLSQR
jgi:hypothetical protein